MATTYEPIATQTLTTSASSISFTSIPSTYTDLKIVVAALGASSGSYLAMQFNGDTGTNYSYTYIRGRNGAVGASQGTSTARAFILNTGEDLPTTYPALSTIDIFSYANSKNKRCLSTGSDDKNGTGETLSIVNYWRNTSAINRVDIIGYNTNLGTGTVATIYGIKAA